MQVQGSGGLSPIYHLSAQQEQCCKDVADLVFQDKTVESKQIVQNIFEKMHQDGSAEDPRILSNICRIFSQVKNQDNKVKEIRKLCFERLCHDFDEKSIPEQIEFAKETGQQSAFAGFLAQNLGCSELFENWQALELSPLDRLELCKLIAERGERDAEAFVEIIDQLGLDSVEPKDRLDLYTLIVEQSSWGAAKLVKKFDKLGLDSVDPKERLELCRLIAGRGERAAEALVQKFDQLGLNSLDLKDRFDLCRLIAGQGERAAKALVEKFDRLGLNSLDLKDRLELCKLIAGLGGNAVTVLVNNIHKFKLDGIDVQDRLDLCKLIAGQHEKAAQALAAQSLLGLWSREFDQQSRLELYKLIAQMGQLATTTLFDTLKEFSLPPSDRLYYCNLFLSWGEHAGSALADGFDRYKLNEIDMPDRLNLCKLIAGQSKRGAEILVEKFDKLGLDSVNPKDRLDLCKLIAGQGPVAAMALAKNFGKFGLETSSSKDLLDLCKLMTDGKNKVAEVLFKDFYQLGLNRMDREDRLEFFKSLVMGLPDYNFLEKGLISNLDKLGSDIFAEPDLFQRCRIIATWGGNAAKTLAKYLRSSELRSVSPKQYLDLCTLIAEQGEGAAHSLADSFDPSRLVGIDVQDRLEFYRLIAGQGDNTAAHLVGFNFYKLNLDGIDVLDRFELCNLIARQGTNAAAALANHFGEFNVDGIALLDFELCKLIAGQGDKAAAALAKHFNKFKLDGIDVQDRMELCKLIAGQGNDAAAALAYNFNKFKLDGIDVRGRMELCELIAGQGSNAVAALANKFGDFNLDEIDVQGRMELCKIIAARGEESTKSLLRNFDKFKLNGFDEQNRLKLCKLITGQGDSAAGAVAQHFDQFNLGGISEQNRFELCKLIAGRGESAAGAVAQNFNKFNLDGIDERNRFELCKLIAGQGESAAESVAYYFNKFKLDGIDVQVRLELCKLIVAQGVTAIRAIRQSFDQWNLDPDACISLARCIADLGLESIEYFDQISIKNMKDSTKRQMYLEFCKPPSNYRGRKAPSLSDAFRSDSEVSLFNVLQKQPTDSVEESIADLKEFVKVFEKINPLEPILMKLKGEPDGHLKSVMLNWTAYAAGVLYDVVEVKQRLDSTPQKVGTLADEAIKAWKSIKKSGILLDIYEHKNPSARYLFMRLLSDMAKHYPETLPTRREPQKPWVSLSRLLISPLRGFGLEEERIEALLKKISEKDFRDASDFRSLVHYFEALIDQGPFSNEEITSIVDIALEILEDIPSGKQEDRRTLKPGLDRFDGLTNILKILGKKQFVDCVRNKTNPKEFFGLHFKGLFELEDVQAIFDKYLNTFGRFRDDTALYSYLRSVQSLPPYQRKPVFEGLKSYVRAVLEGDFREIRYNEATSKHLEKIFAEPVIKEKWRATAEPTGVSLRTEKNVDIDYKTFFRTKILVDGHINPDAVPRLVSFLNGEEVEILESEEPMDKLQNLAIQLIRNEIDVDQFISGVRELRDIPAPFQNDLDALKPQTHFGTHTIQESDDPCDLLLIGTEIKGSCQSVKGSPTFNKCLVSYLMNGEVRAIVIKDAEGKIVARSVMRLMLDEDTQTPTILLERVYSNVVGNKAKEAIAKWAIAKAQEMNVPLVSKEVGQGPGFQGIVAHLGGYAPFVYSDAAVGVMNGPYKITKDLHILYSPSPE